LSCTFAIYLDLVQERDIDSFVRAVGTLQAVDVNHDYDTAPTMSKERFQPLKLGDGMTLCVGAISSEQLNAQIERAATARGVNVQRDVRGRDTGTDAMAAVLASVDCAATSVGFPIRNMHTISELAHTADVLGCVEALHHWLELAAEAKLTAADFQVGHPRLDYASRIAVVPPAAAD
jgi:putative aminopeptidase FrvX